MRTAVFYTSIFALVSSVFATFVGFFVGGLWYVRYIYAPSVWFGMEEGKEELLDHECTTTTDYLEDLVVQKEATREEAKQLAMEHGTAVVRNILSTKTVRALHDYTRRANAKLTEDDQVYVHNSEHRYNLSPDHSEPSLREALKEIGRHPVLRPLIDDVLGPKASLTGLSILTAEYGSSDQHVHPDTSSAVVDQPEIFVPEYVLAVALQNITEGMGPTMICPGTHYCYSVKGAEYERDYLTCKVRATLNEGDGFLYMSDLHHMGTAHTDPNADSRSLLFLVLTGSRQGDDDDRQIPLGNVRSMNINMWGHTIDEFENVENWKIWHSFGLFNKRTDGIRPWNMLDEILTIFHAHDEAALMIGNACTLETFMIFTNKVFAYSFSFMVAYLLVIPNILLYVVWRSSRPTSAAVTAGMESTPVNGKKKDE